MRLPQYELKATPTYESAPTECGSICELQRSSCNWFRGTNLRLSHDGKGADGFLTTCHVESDRLVRSDAFLIVEAKEAKTRTRAAKRRSLNPKPRWAQHPPLLCRNRPKVLALLPPLTPKLEGCKGATCRKCHPSRVYNDRHIALLIDPPDTSGMLVTSAVRRGGCDGRHRRTKAQRVKMQEANLYMLRC